MAAYTCDFILVCMGKLDDIIAFKQNVKKAFENPGFQVEYINVDTEVNPEDWMSFMVKHVKGGICDLFLPMMKEFTAETGAPLSFFFRFNNLSKENSPFSACGCRVFDGITERASQMWKFSADQFAREDDTGGEAGERMLAEMEEIVYTKVWDTYKLWENGNSPGGAPKVLP
jgi:hypothetical protein